MILIKVPPSPSPDSPREHIFSIDSLELGSDSPDEVTFRPFVSKTCGATAFSTGLAVLRPGGRLPYHIHPVSEALTVVEGSARFFVEGRVYSLNRRDCAHVPAGRPHSVQNDDGSRKLVLHTTFGSASPSREMVAVDLPVVERGLGISAKDDPETIVRFEKSPVYELSENAFFTDLFARRLGAVGICGGYGRFRPGASLPCHIHDYDESITIVEGAATCLVQGRQYELQGCATAYVPKGLAHRFINTSSKEMAMIWVYAGDEPDRRVVDNGYCSGMLTWPGADLVGREDNSHKAE